MDRNRQRRAGFTLVELLMVIVIIGILLGLLIPTVFAAFRKAREAAVVAEINNMATALNDFKSKFGDYPPSRVMLFEGGYNATLLASTSPIVGESTAVGAGNDITEGQLAQRSLVSLRKFWPRCTFQGTYDFNGDGHINSNSYYVLSGSECLAFFLGGMPGPSVSNTNGISLVGFGRLPTNPFQSLANTGTNRTQPLYEFNNGRLLDVDGDGFPSYMDAMSNPTGDQIPYAYFSSYGSNGYDPNDVNGIGGTNLNTMGYYSSLSNGFAAPNLGIEVTDSSVSNPVLVARSLSVSFNGGAVVSPAPNPYTTNLPFVSSGPGANYFNSNSFQIIAAGQDRMFGLGGIYLPNAPSGSRLPFDAAGSPNLNTSLTVADADVYARGTDNLTNFSAGRLD